MSLIKLNDRAVKDVTQFGSISSLGSLTHISTATASASASIEFTLGDYKEYKFFFVNIHPSTNNAYFQFNFSTDSGSNYNVTKTTTFFNAYHGETGIDPTLTYQSGRDLAQSTAFQDIDYSQNNQSDSNLNGTLQVFNPSSTTYVKHFISDCNSNHGAGNYCMRTFVAGYGNTQSAINSIKFQMSSGNIDAGQILLFGIN
jgi:hypothetical protein